LQDRELTNSQNLTLFKIRRKYMNRLIVLLVFNLSLTVSPVKASSLISGNELLKVGEDFKKSNSPDSAIKYFKLAALEFEKEKNTASFIHANNQAGILLTRQDNYSEAKSILEKSLFAANDPSDSIQLLIATTYISLGVVFGGEDDFVRALVNHNKALEIRLRILGNDHRDVATSYGNIGNIYFRKKEYDEAIVNHTKALQIRQKLFGEMGVEVIQSYANLGNAFREQKKFDTALNYFEKALAGKIAQVGEGHKELSRYYKSISDVYYLMKKADLGDSYLKKSQAVSE
jgi:tetratricopeptide (TPR) repeat protein